MPKKRSIVLNFPSNSLTKRANNDYSYYIDVGGPLIEGSALNGNYRDVEAACIISNALGEAGYRYGEDFVFETCGLDKVVILFFTDEAATYAAMKLPTLPKEDLEI